MAKVLYFDCFSGISGDMVLGAFLDAGLPFDELKRALGSLAMAGYEITAERVLRTGISATKFSVDEHSSHRPGDEAGKPEPTHQHDNHGHRHDDYAHAHDYREHSHDHPHDHEHAAGPDSRAQPSHRHDGHAHRTLPEIFGLIDQSALSI